ncbi:transcription factor Homeodomain-TALE-BEL family [Salix suchowensis]|nr:transcription factor Homeodomain-TALE-BEL family [Salix suchowensis]
MALRRPAMNRSCNRENPDILIVMIAEKQIMRGDEDDKERETMGPQKPAREMSGTAPKRSLHILSTGVVQTTLSSVYKVCWSTLYYRVCLLLGDHHSANVNKSSLGLSSSFPLLSLGAILVRLQLHGLYRPSLISLLCFYTANSAREIWKLKMRGAPHKCKERCFASESRLACK